MTLTISETVTPYNIERLTRLYNNGPHTYPGSKFV